MRPQGEGLALWSNWSPEAETTWPGGTSQRGRIFAGRHGQTHSSLAEWDMQIRVRFMRPGPDWYRKVTLPFTPPFCGGGVTGGG